MNGNLFDRGGPSRAGASSIRMTAAMQASQASSMNGAQAKEATPGPGAYNVRMAPDATPGLAGSAAFKTKGDRSLVSKDAAALPGIGDYRPKRVELDRGTASGFKSRDERFKASDTQKATVKVGPAAYSQAHGTMASAASKARAAPSSMFASTVIRSSWVPMAKGEAERLLREAEEEEYRRAEWEEEQAAIRAADPEWQAMEAARLAEEEAERLVIEKAAADAAERVRRKEEAEAKAVWLAARAAEEWAWRQAEEEAETAEAAQGIARKRGVLTVDEERRQKGRRRQG